MINLFLWVHSDAAFSMAFSRFTVQPLDQHQRSHA
jgi:hypothetical protein